MELLSWTALVVEMAITEAKAALRSILLSFIFFEILFLFWKIFERLLKLLVTVNIVKFLVLLIQAVYYR